MKILMLCLGNICRSPLAQGILQSKVQQQGLQWEIDSAGTINTHHGEAPDRRSQHIASKHNIDISQQKARCFTMQDLERFDKIFVMDKNNYQDLKKIARSQWKESQVDFILNELYPNENREVADPYYGNEKDFEHSFHILNDACEAILKKYSKP